MRLHTNLTYAQVYFALKQARDAGLIAPDVQFVGMTDHKSRTHPHAFEIQLGTADKFSLPAGYTDQNGHKLKTRRFKSAKYIAPDGCYEPPVWAATWHEWGWFISAVFQLDQGARWGDEKHPQYADAEDFERKTKGEFDPAGMTFPKGRSA